MNARNVAARAVAALVPLFGLAPDARGQCLDWSDAFGAPGTDDGVRASVVYDDGSGAGPALVVGGSFRSAGGILASRIARWNGDSWEALGTGLGGSPWASVSDLAVHDEGPGPVLFAAGSFERAGGLPAANVARWDGAGWSGVGGGTDGGIGALAVFDDGLGAGPCLYAGGSFAAAGGAPARCLARWDGAGWSEVGGGLDGPVHALVVHDDGGGPALFVAGGFTQTGATPAAHVARWDGVSWSALGAGTDGWVQALAAYDSGAGAELYAGGSFGAAGGLPASRVARWDGLSWSPLGSGVDGSVAALGVHDDGTGPALIAGGYFAHAGGSPASGIARWQSAGWSALDGGVEIPSVSTVCSLAPGHAGAPLLVAGGDFHAADSTVALGVAAWDGTAWSALGAGQGLFVDVNSTAWGLRDLAVFDDGQGGGPALFAAGGFASAGNALTGPLGLARWDGAGWTAIPDQPYGYLPAQALAVFDPGSGPGLYVGKAFGLSMWNGTDWDTSQQLSLHGSMGGARALVVHDDGSGPALYVGGDFSDGCFSGWPNIVRWDGASCSSVGFGVAPVQALLAFDDGTGPALYAGGGLSYPNVYGYVARWDGIQWTDLGGGMDRPVYALAGFDDGSGPALFAGGSFQIAGGAPAVGIARWRGDGWAPVGAGVTDPLFTDVNALAVHDDGRGAGSALYAAGPFREMDHVPAAGIARWNGARWSPLGLGIEAGSYEEPLTLLSVEDGGQARLFVGGTFSLAGGRPSLAIARWGDACGCGALVYCTAKTNSQGCQPSMSAAGDTSLTGGAPLTLSATHVLNNRLGLLVYGKCGASGHPFQGGTLCVRPPLRRTPAQTSGGSPPPDDCSGSFALDFKRWALSGADPGLVAGVSVNAQYWYRDRTAAQGAGLTDAVAFALCP